MVLDNLTNFASFVSQFTPINVVFCQKNKDNINGNIRMMKLMIMINDVKSSKCRRLKHFSPVFWIGRCTFYTINAVTKADCHNLGHPLCKFLQTEIIFLKMSKLKKSSFALPLIKKNLKFPLNIKPLLFGGIWRTLKWERLEQMPMKWFILSSESNIELICNLRLPPSPALLVWRANLLPYQGWMQYCKHRNWPQVQVGPGYHYILEIRQVQCHP